MDSSLVFARWRQCSPHRTHASLGPPESTTQTAFRSVQTFCIAHGRYRYTLQWDAPPASKQSKRLDGSGCHLVCRSASAQSTVLDGYPASPQKSTQQPLLPKPEVVLTVCGLFTGGHFTGDYSPGGQFTRRLYIGVRFTGRCVV